MDHAELKEIVRAVVRELQAERQAELEGRLAKAREARAVKLKENSPHGFVMTENIQAVLDALRKVQPATLAEWRKEFLWLSRSTPDTARKMFSRTVVKLTTAKLVVENEAGHYEVAGS